MLVCLFVFFFWWGGVPMMDVTILDDLNVSQGKKKNLPSL